MEERMHLKHARRAAATATIVTLAAAPIALSATQATAVTKKATSLSIRTAHSAVPPRTKDTISGVLKSGTAALPGQKVTLHERKYGTSAWTTYGSALTNAGGAVSFSLLPANLREQYELTYAGNATYAASHSGIVTVTVKRTTSLSIAAAHTTVKPKTRDTISGVLRSGSTGLANQIVTLRERKYGTTKWIVVTSHTTGTGGKVSFSVLPPNSKEQYQLGFAGTLRYFPSHSGTVTVTVS
jgi:hypothetical protein